MARHSSAQVNICSHFRIRVPSPLARISMRALIGKVVSTKTQTAVVRVERFFIHPLYERRIKRARKYHVYDELGVKEGDEVKFVQTRPLSKTKKWKVVEILK